MWISCHPVTVFTWNLIHPQQLCTCEWIGTIPGKRESLRFEGDCMMSQSDILDQKCFEDAVSFRRVGDRRMAIEKKLMLIR